MDFGGLVRAVRRLVGLGPMPLLGCAAAFCAIVASIKYGGEESHYIGEGYGYYTTPDHTWCLWALTSGICMTVMVAIRWRQAAVKRRFEADQRQAAENDLAHQRAVELAKAKARERLIERQMVVARCKFCGTLTPVDLENCKHCGASKFC